MKVSSKNGGRRRWDTRLVGVMGSTSGKIMAVSSFFQRIAILGARKSGLVGSRSDCVENMKGVGIRNDVAETERAGTRQ